MEQSTDKKEPLIPPSATDPVNSSEDSYIPVGICGSGEVPQNVTMKKPRTPCTRPHLPGEKCGQNERAKGRRNKSGSPISTSSLTPSAVSPNSSFQSMRDVVGDIEEGKSSLQSSDFPTQNTEHSISSAGHIEENNEHHHIDLETQNPTLYKKVQKLESILVALGSQTEHQCGHAHGSPDEEKNENTTEQNWKKFWTKLLINWGNEFGERSAGANALFIIPPIIDDFLSLYSKIASSSFFLNPAFTRLNLSLFAIAVSVYPIWCTMRDSAYCHKKQEIYNDFREELTALINNAIHEAEHGIDITDTLVAINSKINVKLSDFDIISPEDLPELSKTDKRRLRNDVGGHMIEFTGLTIFALSLVTNDIRIKLPLSALFLLFSRVACSSEKATCENTLKRMAALKNGKIINDPAANGEANIWTILSATTKFPALITASILDLRTAFFDFLPAAILLGFATAAADTICQYILNVNNQSPGEMVNQDSQQKSNLTKWEKWNLLTNTGQCLVSARAVGTAFERSAPIVILLSLALQLSKTNQSTLAGAAFLLYLTTTYSLVNFNDVPNLLRKDRTLLGGMLHTKKDREIIIAGKSVATDNPLHTLV
jgi:hypothetical protein